MPNWVYNRVSFCATPAKFKQIKSALISEDKEFDFNNIIPMPKELDIESSSIGELSVKYYKKYLALIEEERRKILGEANDEVKKKIEEKCKKEIFAKMMEDFPQWSEDSIKEGFELARKYIKNEEKYGARDWYEWRVSSRGWGTKWNASEIHWYDDDDQMVEFNTPWSMPEPIYKKMSEMFGVTITVNVEEESGAFKGDVIYKDGEVLVDDTYEVHMNEYGYEIDDSHTEPRVGDYICIRCMENVPAYEGKTGRIESIDDAGQLHGTWGGCAIIPGTDEFDIIIDY